MADIAFLLLIFFLVTTTMNVDSGLSRTLPPLVDNKLDDGVEVKERNVLAIKVSGNDMVLVAGQRVRPTDVREMAKTFAINANDLETLPEKEEKEIPLLGKFMVSKGVISLQNDRSTSYEIYLAVQNELTKAFNELRNELSNTKFNRNFAELTADEKAAITAAIPVKISEAEPVDLTKKK